MELLKVESLFNEIFKFDKIVTEAKKHIETVLLESDTNFLSEEFRDNKPIYKLLRVIYVKTQLFINEDGRKPHFRLQFYLYDKYDSEIPKYIYEIEYDSAGNFSDEYFLKY